MSEWSKVCLGELIKVKHGFAFPGQFITSEMTDRILVTPGNFCIGGGFKQGKFKYFSSHDYPAEYQFLGGELIVTMTDLSKETDTLGYSAVVPSDGKVYLHNQRVGLIEPISAQSCLEFVYWLMRWRDYQEFIVNSASGTSVMHTSPSRICEFEFELPPLPEQKAIASVLSSLDDKIDLLHRQNKTLEAMAETLFRQWFIEEAKEDWEEASLGSLFTISSGKGLKREQFRDHGLIPVLGANGEIGRTDQVMFEEFLIYTGRVGTLGKVSIIEGQPVWLSDNTLVFRDIEYFYFTYFQLKAVNYQEYNVGSTQPLIRQSDIKEIAVLLPSDLDMIKRFELQAKDIFGKIQTNTKQIQTLENLRNTLLPKLMSGEVRVQYQTEEVA